MTSSPHSVSLPWSTKQLSKETSHRGKRDLHVGTFESLPW
jgi:hypothetical protein